jgi:hypothetical protein
MNTGISEINWQTYVENLYLESNEKDSEFKQRPIFHDPASPNGISNFENTIGLKFHDEIKGLLLQTNGIHGIVTLPSGEEFPDEPLIFDLDQMLEINQHHRKDRNVRDTFMPFSNLLLVSHDGTGNYFCYGYTATRKPTWDIFFWDHETDSRLSIARGLDSFIRQKILDTLFQSDE